jgi:hypothetical protein
MTLHPLRVVWKPKMVPGGNVSTCNDLGGVRFRWEPSRVRAETLSDA